jgi:hypothetical protein
MEEKPKRTKVAGSGRKKKAGKKISPRLADDVIDILKEQENQTEYLETAVREKYARDRNPAELAVKI